MLRFPLLQLAFGAAKKRRNLNRMGFNVGEPDGRLGPRTKEALMAFQHQKGFNATGEIDRETFAALRSEGGQQGNEGKAVEASAATSRPPRVRVAISGSPQVISSSPLTSRGQISKRKVASGKAGPTSHKAQVRPPMQAGPPPRVRAVQGPVQTTPRTPTRPVHLGSGRTISKGDVIDKDRCQLTGLIGGLL